MYYDCQWDGPEHNHQTQAEVDTCIADFNEAMEIELWRWNNPDLDAFFRDSDNDHLINWHAER